MRAILGILLVLVVALIAAFALGLVDLNATGGKLPEIRAEAGKLPDVDVSTAEIDVGTKNETIEVPTIDVKRANEK